MLTLAVAEILTEVNSFSPITTTLRDFQAGSLVTGAEILPRAREEKLEIAGFLKAVEELGEGQIEVAPILKARAVPGGPVEREVYEQFKTSLVEGLRSIERLDGVYLSMHGSMGVEGVRDPEGDLLRAVREVVGVDLPIGVSFDLHANVTEERARLASFIVGYKTNPHRDHFETGYRTGEILVKTVQGRVNPVMAFNKMRLLKGGGLCMDVLRPMRKIFRAMKRMEHSSQVLCVSNFTVHLFIDDPEAGWSTVAVTDDAPELGRRLADELAEMNWAVREVKHTEPETPSRAVAIARRKWLRRRLGPVMFSDTSDNVLSGAPGESTAILKTLVEEAPDLTSYLSIRDAEAAQQACSGDVGDTITLNVGGKLDTVYNSPLEITGELLSRTETNLGRTAVLRHGGVHLVVHELSAGAAHPSFYTDLGLSIWKADIVVVKSVFHFRWYYLRYNRKTVYVDGGGTTSYNVFDLEYRNIPRPIYPLDPDIASWRPS
jgi:microcystin degradation protein MlrC